MDGAPYFRTLPVQFPRTRSTCTRRLQVPEPLFGRGRVFVFSPMLMCTLWTSIPCITPLLTTLNHPYLVSALP